MLLKIVEEDDSDDSEGQEQVIAITQDKQISNEKKDTQSSAGNSSSISIF